MSIPGRDAELGLLRRSARAAAAGAGTAVLVEGPAGLGKSFLLDAAARGTELRVLRGRAWEEGGAPPYWPWREVAAAGGWSFDADDPADPFALCSSVLSRLRTCATETPLMVVLDDLHAADEDSLRLARYVARSISDAPILLLAAARPSDRLGELEGLRVALRPLEGEAAAQVVDLWAPLELDEATRRHVVDQARATRCASGSWPAWRTSEAPRPQGCGPPSCGASQVSMLRPGRCWRRLPCSAGTSTSWTSAGCSTRSRLVSCPASTPRSGTASSSPSKGRPGASATSCSGTLPTTPSRRPARLMTDLGAADHLPLLAEALHRAEREGARAVAVRLRARRSVLLSGLDRFGPARADADLAMEGARLLGDSGVLADALGALHMTCWRDGCEQEAAQVSRELVEVSGRAGDDDRLLDALLARLVDALKSADLAAVDESLEAVIALADRTGRPRHRYFADSRRAMRSFLAGRLAEGDRLSEQARALGERIEEPDTFQVFTGSRLLVMGELLSEDELAEQAEGLSRLFEETGLGWLLSVIWLAAGRPDRALEAVRTGVGDVPGPLARAGALELCMRALVVAQAGDVELAATLARLLRPHAGRVVVNAGAVTF